MKKGQAAMEFLMTYGWAILVVLAAIAALAYFGVLSPARFLPERCDFPAGLTCVDKAVFSASANTVTMAIRNNVGDSVNISSATVPSGDDCGSVSSLTVGGASPPVTVTNNQLVTVVVTCSADLISDDRIKSDITLNYVKLETGLTHPSAGTVTGRVA